MQGQIIKIISDLHVVSFQNGVLNCKCRGKFRNEKMIPQVGDYVIFNKEKKVIERILPRKNVFERPKVCNIDQAFLITSLKCPDFSLNLLDRLIIWMELHKVESIICITKKDLIENEELKIINNTLNYYKELGYKVVFNDEIDSIKKLLKGKTSVFTGQTGAGKSTLLNRLNPNWNLETGEVSKSLGRGKHTTRVVELFELEGGKVLDTPGFSALDFSSFTDFEIRDAFPEFKRYPCLYHDCMHKKEEECRVKKAVNDNNIIRSRYNHYLRFIERK